MLRLAFKDDFDNIHGDPVNNEIFGIVFALKQVGISRALGRTEHGRLVMFQVIARIVHAGSRLSAVRWAHQHAVNDVGVKDYPDL